MKGFDFAAIPAAHEQLATDEHGRHLYLGYIVRVGPITIYHSGDTVVYEGMADCFAHASVDVAILPINGKVGNMNGVDAASLPLTSAQTGDSVPLRYVRVQHGVAGRSICSGMRAAGPGV